MDYPQNTPLPTPPVGSQESVPCALETVFDWEYKLDRTKLMALYEKGKAATWNANEINWSVDVSGDRFIEERLASDHHLVLNEVLAPPHPLGAEEAARMSLNINSWMISQFLHGEQGALVGTAKIVLEAPFEEAKFYGANQVADEARHVEVYHRYLTEKMGISYAVNPHLQTLLNQIVSDSRWDMTYLGMQIMVEGLALAAFGLVKIQMPDEPLIQEITSRIIQDEARHVAFGVLTLEDIYHNQLSTAELKEREEFVIESTFLMRDRLLMEQVYERMGWDVDVWVNWAKSTPFMHAFRQMLFSKIVPNLRRLGMLTPKVRQVFDELGILQFEHDKDSSEDANILPPEELLAIMAQFQDAGPDSPVQS
jgi:hypothetical protein